MTHEEFTGVTHNDLDLSGTRISRSSKFSVVSSTEITLCFDGHSVLVVVNFHRTIHTDDRLLSHFFSFSLEKISSSSRSRRQEEISDVLQDLEEPKSTLSLICVIKLLHTCPIFLVCLVPVDCFYISPVLCSVSVAVLSSICVHLSRWITLCTYTVSKKTTLMLHTITSAHINRFC